MMRTENGLIPLDGTYNTRDVGGYRTSNGHVIQPHRLLRSDSLHALTSADVARLHDLGLKTVVDLRRDEEREQEPNRLAGEAWIDYHPNPLYDREPYARGIPVHQVAGYYCALVDTSQPEIRDVLRLLADPASYPVLVHCAVGKDRTGLLVALALALAHVPPATIAADYALSDALIEPLKPKYRHLFQVNTTLPPETYEALLTAPPQAMLDLLRYLEVQYGGVVPYARQIGLSDRQIQQIRDNLISG